MGELCALFIYLQVQANSPLIRFFRINDPYRLLGILVLLILFSLPLFLHAPPVSPQQLLHLLVGEAVWDGHTMYVEIFDSTAPFSAGVFGLLDGLFGRSLFARQLLTILFLFLQAAFFAILLINNKAYNDNTYVPGLIFGILCFVSYDFLTFSPELLGSSVLLLALNNLFKEIEFRIQREETILSLGVYIGAASIFVFSYSLFLVAALVILILFTRISIRKALLLIFGFLLPHTILFLLYLRWDETTWLWQNFYAPNLALSAEPLISWKSLLYLLLVPAVYFVISLFMLTREARFTKYQSQLFQVMFLWMIFSFIEILITKQRTPHSFLTILPSLTYFVSHYLLIIRRKWIAETMLWIFMIGILLVSNLTRAGRIDWVDYSKMILPKNDIMGGKRVMLLGDGISVYQQNSLGGYFLNWPLSRETVRGIDYFENVETLWQSFQRNPPDVIIDQEKLAPAMFKRLPSVAKQYRKEGDVYWRVSSN